jgi:hypothetical protein
MNVPVTGREKLLVSRAIATACAARISPTTMFQVRRLYSFFSVDWSEVIELLLSEFLIGIVVVPGNYMVFYYTINSPASSLISGAGRRNGQMLSRSSYKK